MDSSPLHVLIIDDSPEDRLTLRRYLTRHAPGSYTFSEADHGDHGLSACQAAPPDCVLLDYNLPGNDGMAVLAALRTFSDVPVIMFTGVGNETLAVQALQQGAQDYLVKGTLTPERLHLTVQRAVANAHEVAARKRAELARERATVRLQVLADASQAFASAGIDAQALLERIACISADSLHAACIIRLRTDDPQWLETVTIYDPNPSARAAMQAIYAGVRIPIDAAHPTAEVVRSGQALLIPVIDPQAIHALLSPETRPALEIMPAQSVIAVPLRAHGQILGSVVFARANPGAATFTQDDLTLAQDLADRAALALASARLYHEAQAARQAADETLARLSALVTSSPGGIGYLDRDLRYQLVNPALASINGFSPAEHVGRTPADMMPGLAPRLEPLMRQVLATGQAIRDFELHGKPCPRDGVSHEWLVSYFPIPAPTGEITGVGVTVTNITASKRTEVALKRSADRLHVLADASRAFAEAGSEHQTVIEQLAKTVSTVLSEGCLIGLLSEDRQWLIQTTQHDIDPQVREIYQRILSSPVHIEEPTFTTGLIRSQQPLFMPTIDRQQFSAAIHSKFLELAERLGIHSLIVVPMRVQGDVIGVMTIYRYDRERPPFDDDDLRLAQDLADRAALAISGARLFKQVQSELAERRRAEQALEAERALLARRVAERTADLSGANAELARAAQAKDEFLANMSHELRTPLNAILAFSESLQEGIYGPLDPRQLDALQAIESGGRHLLTLIGDILDLAKVEAGQLDLQVEPILIDDVCQASLLFVRELALKKSLQLGFHLDDESATISVDPRRLKQMLVNLLSNAVKFTPARGTLRLDVTTDVDAGEARFAVIDTGIGIAPEDLARLFQPFSQLDSNLSRQHEGTGLGLALVRRLAELHGGSVAVESTPGVGSCFTIALPYAREGPPAADHAPDATAEAIRPISPASMAAERAGGLILLVEDHEANINVIGAYLRSNSHQVIVARNGYEAIERAEEAQPDLILMDIQMPGMDGLEATRRLRALPAHTTTPIIALTALAMPDDRERCLAAGATEYMTKPVSLRRLQVLIQQLIGG
jgi:PAS domain S-box-containing protein